MSFENYVGSNWCCLTLAALTHKQIGVDRSCQEVDSGCRCCWRCCWQTRATSRARDPAEPSQPSTVNTAGDDAVAEAGSNATDVETVVG